MAGFFTLPPLTGAVTVPYEIFSEIQTLQGSAVDKLMRNTIVAVRSKELITGEMWRNDCIYLGFVSLSAGS